MLIWRSIRHTWYETEDRLRRLRFEDLINRNPKTALGACLAVGILLFLIVTTLFIPHNRPMNSTPQEVWFYDLNTQKLFTAKSDNIAPIDAPSGRLSDGQPAGVRAYLFSYCKNPKESECFISYLEKFTSEGEQLIASIRKSKNDVTGEIARTLNKNRLIRRPFDTHWYSADSKEGRSILNQVMRPNELGQMPRIYLPK